MNITQAVALACKQPTLTEALSSICNWECDRVVDQARNRFGTGTNGAGYDTCFERCIEEVLKAYPKYLNQNTEPIQVHDILIHKITHVPNIYRVTAIKLGGLKEEGYVELSPLENTSDFPIRIPHLMLDDLVKAGIVTVAWRKK